MKRSHILVLPLCLAALAAILFASQGGFGAGHGDFDLAIWALGLPGTLGTPFLSRWTGDLVAFVVLPAAVNLVVWFAATSFVQNRLKPRRT
jgi:hypothetical protein